MHQQEDPNNVEKYFLNIGVGGKEWTGVLDDMDQQTWRW